LKSLKIYLQLLIRNFNVLFFRKNLPTKIAIYFHDLKEKDLENIKTIIRFFKFLNYEFCTIDKFSENIKNNHKQLALTFDDGFSSWTKTLKLFEEENVKATFYLNSIFFEDNLKLDKFYKNINSKGTEKLIDISEVYMLIDKGHQIGSHSHSHHTLSGLNQSDFEFEINKNLEILNNLKVQLNSFAIPFGMRRYLTNQQFEYLNNIFNTVCYGEPGMLYNHTPDKIQRYPWLSEKSFLFNLINISTNTSIFNNLTKRSGLG